ncbi:MAG TPA: hypothetical protein VKI19_00820 [Acidimicrobiales bacterium]|nr:hypothetical protein [Acidimicrobiales bacterium]
MKRALVGFMVAGGLTLMAPASMAFADTSPNGPGQPGAPGTTCGGPAGNANSTPGASASAQGSPFNPSGRAGQVYAGNPGTASLAHAQSTHAVSQYDIACFQVSN